MSIERKKLCIIVPTHWSVKMGGSPYEAKTLIETLRKDNHYEIFCLVSRVDIKIQLDGYKLVKIADRNGLRRYGFFFDVLSLLKILKQIKPDIIYQLVGCAYTGIAAYYAKKRDCNMVWRVQHDWDVSPFEWKVSANLPFRYLEKNFLNYGIASVHHIVAQTNHQNELLKANYGRSATAIIPNFHPIPREKILKRNPIRVVWVANFKVWKRPEIFVSLAKDLQSFKDVCFIMIGKSELDKIKHQKLVNEMAALKNFNYLGQCTQEQVNSVLADSHIFVNTSIYEGFPHTFVQAWMRQVPVVSLAVNPDKLLTHEDIGFFADESYETLRDQVVMLIKNDNLRDEVGRKAQQFAFKNYSQECIKKLIEVFETKKIKN